MSETARRQRASAPRKRQLGRSRKLRKWLLFFSIFTLFLIGGVAGAVYWKIDSTLDIVTQPKDGTSPSTTQPVDAEYSTEKPLSLVILGSDTRPETGSMNTDVMVVAVVNPETKKVTMVSLPRDTRVKIPGYSDYHKINSVYANGEAERRKAERNDEVPTEDGVSLTKKTLSEILGIPIDHYVAFDFDGFKAVIDELGGIEVNVDRRLVYDDPTDDTHIDLQPGLQVLNGEQALGYVRHRHDNRGTKYYSSDFDRNRRQQEVIRAVIDKAASLEGLTKVFAILDVGAKHIHTDLSKDQIMGLAYDFKGINSSAITTLDNGAYWQGGYTYLEKEKLEQIRSSLQAEMGLERSVVAKLNNSPVLGTGSSSVASSGSSGSSKKTTKKTIETAAPAVQQEKKQVTEQPKQEEQTVDQSEEELAEGVMPPPDIVSPDQTPDPDGTVVTDPQTPGEPQGTTNPQTDGQTQVSPNPSTPPTVEQDASSPPTQTEQAPPPDISSSVSQQEMSQVPPVN